MTPPYLIICIGPVEQHWVEGSKVSKMGWEGIQRQSLSFLLPVLCMLKTLDGVMGMTLGKERRRIVYTGPVAPVGGAVELFWDFPRCRCPPRRLPPPDLG